MWRERLQPTPQWPDVLLKRRSPDKAKQAMEMFLDSVVALKPLARRRPEPGELSEIAVKLLIKLAVEPHKFLTEVYSDLAFHPSTGKAALDELLARGFAKIHRIPRKGRGSQYAVVQITEHADGELGKRGITRPKPVLKGGFKHDVYGRRLGRWATKGHYRHWWERTLGKKTFDFVYELPGGNLVAVEVCLSGSAKLNAEQALKGLENEGIKELILACETKKFADAIMKELEKLDMLGLYRGRVRVCQLAEFLE